MGPFTAGTEGSESDLQRKRRCPKMVGVRIALLAVALMVACGLAGGTSAARPDAVSGGPPSLDPLVLKPAQVAAAESRRNLERG